jgi:Holliday junction resolvase RusA-like endonuclease
LQNGKKERGVNIEFYGVIPSKKNGKRTIQRGGRRFQVPSAAFEAWNQCEVARLKAIYECPRLVGFGLEVRLYLPNNRVRDTDNVITSLLDVLKDGQVIKDDRHQYMFAPPWIHQPEIDPINPRAIVVVHLASASFYEARLKRDSSMLQSEISDR